MTDNELYDLYDVCYECTGYGDNYRYDEELNELICNCDDCWVTKTQELEEDE